MSGAEGQTVSAFKRFRELTRKLAAVPKREANEQKAKKPRRSSPTPKSA